MHVLKTKFQGNSNIGLFGLVTDKHFLLGKGIEVNEKELKETFEKDVLRVSLAGTPLIGVFAAWNSKGILLPGIVFEEEVAFLEKAGYKVHVMDTKLTCLGNNILVNEEVAFVNPEFTDEEVKQIGEALDVKVIKYQIKDYETIGSLAVFNKNGLLLSFETSDKDIKKFEKEFNTTVETGSVNAGSAFVRSGIISNDEGFIIGEESTGPEIVQADRVLSGRT